MNWDAIHYAVLGSSIATLAHLFRHWWVGYQYEQGRAHAADCVAKRELPQYDKRKSRAFHEGVKLGMLEGLANDVRDHALSGPDPVEVAKHNQAVLDAVVGELKRWPVTHDCAADRAIVSGMWVDADIDRLQPSALGATQGYEAAARRIIAAVKGLRHEG